MAESCRHGCSNYHASTARDAHEATTSGACASFSAETVRSRRYRQPFQLLAGLTVHFPEEQKQKPVEDRSDQDR